MNSLAYRIVFNAARGHLMAVSEVTTSAGKDASGERNGVSFSAPSLVSHALNDMYSIAFKLTAVMLGCATVMAALMPTAHAQTQPAPTTTQIKKDTSAPGYQHPTITQTANGVTQVNIQTPSAAGVSRNSYSQFDVGNAGVILNNSRTTTQTQLGGWVQANPWLATGGARVILNEVNSTSPSLLHGAVEVAGQRADVIIANPSGISVNGASFINASGVTLTTGTPMMSGGALTGFQVRGGNINIAGTGLDTSSADYTAILARAVQVNAGIWAKDLTTVTGANQINATNLSATTIAPNTAEPTPAFALDVAALGGMYAGKITLVGTEAGVGVNNAGTIAASAGDLTINSSGWLSNSGIAQASVAVTFAAQGDITNTGTLYAGRNTTLTAVGGVTNSGLLAAQSDVSIAAKTLNSSASSVMGAGIKTDGTFASSGNLSITADQSLQAHGQNLAAGALTFQGQSVNLSGSQTQAHQISINSAGVLSTANATVLAAQGANLQSAGLNNDAGLIQTGSDLIINTHGQALTNTHAANYVSANTQLNGKGGIVSQGATTLSTGELNNASGYLGSVGTLHVASTNINNTGAAQIQGLGDLNLVSNAGSIDNTSGLIRGSRVVNLTAAHVINSNTAGVDQGIEGKDVNISAPATENDHGAIRANNNLTLNSSTHVNNAAGLISAGNTLKVQDTQAAGERTLAVDNTDASLIAGQNLVTSALSLSGNGKILSQGNLSLSLNSDFTNSNQLIANGNLSLSSKGDVSNSGQLKAGLALSISANNLDNAATGEISGGTTQINIASTLNNRGLVDGGLTQITAATVNNLGTGRTYGDELSIAANNLKNAEETVTGITTAATIASRDRLDLGIADTLTNREHALIYSAGDMAMGGAINAAGHATGAAIAVNNNSATIKADGNLSLSSKTLANTNDHFSYETRVASTEVGIREDITSELYRVFTRTTYLPYQTNSDPAQILAGGDLTLNTQSARNYASHIVAGGTLTDVASTLHNEDVTATKTIQDIGTTYTLVHVPGSGICGKIQIECKHAHNEWQSGPYNPAPAISTVVVAQTTPSAAAGMVVAMRTNAAINENISNATGANTHASTSAQTALPNSSLYKTNPSPTTGYLIETDPRFIDKKQWLSSDYMIGSLGLDPSVTQKRLGDGYYEQQLVREQVAQLTGQRFLTDFTSDEQEYKALMSNALTFATQYNLRPGISLSAAQIAQLTSDIVWLVERSVTLPDGSVQKVLVPQIYVKVQPGDLDGSGALLSGKNININLAGDLTNTGTIAGRQLVRLDAQNVNNLGGRLSADSLSVSAQQDVNNIGGQLQAISGMDVSAGRDLNMQTTTQTTHNVLGLDSAERTSVDRVAGLYVSGAAGTLLASAGRDANIIAGVISNQGSGSTTVVAGNNVNLSTVQTGEQNKIIWDADNHLSYGSTTEVGSQVTTAGSLTLGANKNVDVRAANLQSAGALSVQAGNDVNLVAGQATSNLDEAHKFTSSGLLSSTTSISKKTNNDVSTRSSSLGGNTVTIQSGQDITVTGSSVIAQGDTNLVAGRDVVVQSAVNTSRASEFHKTESSGFSFSPMAGLSYGNSSADQSQGVNQVSNAAASVSGSNVSIAAQRDATVAASNVIADQNIDITATRNVNILAAHDAQNSTQDAHASSTSIGLMPGLSGRFTVFGQTDSQQHGNSDGTTASTSVLSANNGSLNVTAGANQGTLTTQGAELLAKQSVNLSAGTVDLQAVQNTAQSTFHSETRSVTVGSALAGVVGSKITAITDSIELAQRTDNARLQGAAALKGAYDAYKFANGGMDSALAKAAANPVAANGDPSGAAFAISVSVGVSESHQDSQSSQTQVRGTSVQAQDIHISATQGDLTATAAKLQADTIALNAAQNLNLVAGTNHEQNSSTNSSSSMGAGVTIGFGQQSGISFQLSAAQAAGKANGSETVYDNTQVTAAKRLTTKSGKDTNLIGAQLAANTVKMEVGTAGGTGQDTGNLNIQTLQDQSSFESEQHSSGFSLSLCIPPFCYGSAVSGSVNLSEQAIQHNYLSAVGQSGIAAGTGGFDINVAGNTDLQGAAITSSAAKEQNKLQTQTLSASDLTNRQSTSSHSMSVSAGTGMSAMAAAATNALANLTGNADLPKNMSEQSSTLSVISPAVISITGNDTQGKTTSEQVASTLTSRDAKSANQTLTNTLTLQQAAQLEQQQKTAQQNQQAANLVGAVMANSIGDLAQKQGWTEGSAQKTLLHGLSGAIQASIAGGNIGAGFASGALNEQLTPVMAKFLADSGIPAQLKDANGKLYDNPAFADLMKAGSTLVGAASGALASGGNLKDAAVGGNLALVNTTENFLSHQAQNQLNALRAKKDLTLDEKRQLVTLELSDQLSDGLLAKQRSGAALSATEKSDLALYLGLYQQDMQAYYGRQYDAAQAQQLANQATQNLLKNGSPTAANYDYPYAADSSTQAAYMAKLRATQGIFAGAPDSANRELFNTAKRDTGMGGSLFGGGITPNEAYLPSALKSAGDFATLDALLNSPVAGASTYLAGTAMGFSKDKLDAATQLSSVLSDIGASFIVPRAGISPAMGETSVVPDPIKTKTVQTNKPIIEPGQGENLSMDGHKIYSSSYPPLSTNPREIYRFSDPKYRPTGSDVYMGDNAATAYFEVRQNVTGKSLFVGQVEVKNVLDLTNPATLTVMNIDPNKLTATATSGNSSTVYQYTNQIANQAYDAGYTGILYPSSRNPTGTAVVLFGGRYDPKAIQPVLDKPIATGAVKP